MTGGSNRHRFGAPKAGCSGWSRTAWAITAIPDVGNRTPDHDLGENGGLIDRPCFRMAGHVAADGRAVRVTGLRLVVYRATEHDQYAV